MSDDYLYEQRALKQGYLKTEIIEKGYDGGEFGEFLSNVREEGTNIDTWTLNELKDLVKKFQNQQTSTSNAYSSTNYDSAPQSTSSNHSDPYKEDPYKSDLYKSDPYKPEPYKAEPIRVDHSLIAGKSDTLASPVVSQQLRVSPDLIRGKFPARGESPMPQKSPDLLRNLSDNTYDQRGRRTSAHPSQEEQKNNAIPRGSAMDSIPKDLQGPSKEQEEIYRGMANVKLAETTPLVENKNVEIFIYGFENSKEGLFSTITTYYKVKTNPWGWDVKRRYTDFAWLRETLRKLHPGLLVPPILKKKTKNKAKPDFTAKRMHFLQKFLQSCVKNEELRADKYLLTFLSCANADQFRNAKKEAEKKAYIYRIREISNIKGQVPLEINKDLKHFAQAVGDFATNVNPIYSKIRKISKQLILDIEAQANTIFQLGECYAGLYAHAMNFNKNTEVGKNPELEDIYLTMNNMLVAWGESQIHQVDNVRKHFVYHYKYAQYELDAFKEIHNMRTKMGVDHITKRKELLAKKDRLFSSKDITKWDLAGTKYNDMLKEDLLNDRKLAYEAMLPKETAIANEYRAVFGFHNSALYNELSRGMEDKAFDYQKNFKEFGQNQGYAMGQLNVKWANLVDHFKFFNDPSYQAQKRDILTRQGVMADRSNIDMSGKYDDD